MHSKVDLISELRIYKEKFLFVIRKHFSSFFSLLFGLVFFFSFLHVDPVHAAIEEDNKLIEKVTKDFSKKFCNSIAFGLSKESALNFSFKENNQIFKKRKGFKNIDQDLLASNISISVVDSCGYILNLRGEEGIQEITKDYLLMQNNN